MIKKLFILFLLLNCILVSSYAAFPIKSTKEIQAVQSTANNENAIRHNRSATSFIARLLQRNAIDERPYDKLRPHRHKITYKRRGMASFLDFIGVYCYGTLLGMQRFYLGYVWQGFVLLTAPYVGGGLIALSLGLAISSPILITAGVVLGAAICAFALGWQISDYVRIRMRTLQPKWGYYIDDVQRVSQFRN